MLIIGLWLLFIQGRKDKHILRWMEYWGNKQSSILLFISRFRESCQFVCVLYTRIFAWIFLLLLINDRNRGQILGCHYAVSVLKRNDSMKEILHVKFFSFQRIPLVVSCLSGTLYSIFMSCFSCDREKDDVLLQSHVRSRLAR